MTTPKTRPGWGRGLAVALAAGALLRVALLVYAERGGAFAFGDGRFYVELGRSLAAGRGMSVSAALFELEPGRPPWAAALMARWRETGMWDFVRPGRPTAFVMPAYPLFVGAVFKACGPSVLAARLVQLLFALALPLLFFDVGRRAFGPRAGVYAAFGGALYPFFIFYAASLTNQLFGIVAVLAVADAYYWAQARPTLRRSLAFGLVGGAAFLVRAELLAPAAVGACLLALAARRYGWRRAVACAAVAALAGLAVATPWAVRNRLSLGRFSYVATQAPRILWEYNVEPLSAAFGAGDVPAYQALYARLRAEELKDLKRADLIPIPRFTTEGEFERADVLQARVTAFLRANPRVYLRLCGIRARQLLRFESLNFRAPVYAAAYAAYPVILLLGVAGLLLAVRRRPGFLYLTVLYAAAVLVFFSFGTAYRAAFLDVLLVLFAAFAAARGVEAVARRRAPADGR